MAVRLSVFVGTSLDGFIARANGDIDWLSDPTKPDATEDYGYQEFFDTVDVLVTGRKTFETVLRMKDWPYTGKNVVVLSRHALNLPPRLKGRVELMNDEPAVIVRRLTARGAKHLYIDGGQTIQGFLRAGMPLDLTITRLPILLGQGIPLFGSFNQDIILQHICTKTFPDGLVQSRYRVTAPLAKGFKNE